MTDQKMCLGIQVLLLLFAHIYAEDSTNGTSNYDSAKKIVDRECSKIRANIVPLPGHTILGGEVASFGEFPHMVTLGYDRGNGLEFDCGGSIISPTFVMTAAHCVITYDRVLPTVVRADVVVIGGNTINDETDVTIAEIITHPSYTRQEKYNDLALLRLSKQLSFSNSLNAICINTDTNDPTTELVITGWGRTSISAKRSDVLLKMYVKAVPRSSCGEFYSKWRKLAHGIAPEQLCAGDPQGLNTICQGNSGSPLQSTDSSNQYTLVGITSFGRGCNASIPTVFTRVSSYLPWIVSQVWPNQ